MKSLKKITLLLLTIFIITTIFNVGVFKAEETYLKKSYTIEAMDTSIYLTIYTTDEAKTNEEFNHVQEMYQKYHELTNNFKALSSDNPYHLKTNIYDINKRPNELIEIDQELYDLLVLSEKIRLETDGFFDYTIGGLIDIWKVYTTPDDFGNTRTLTDQEFSDLMIKVDNYQVISDPVELKEENGKYFVLIKDGVKLDLGGIAKGYVTELARRYLIGQGSNYFLINAGQSSIALGAKPDNADYNIAVQDPTGVLDYYTTISAKNITITTSGNNLQYFLYNNQRYHHIINPKTKMPAPYYHSLTLIGDNAGYGDAYSTGLFSLDEETLNTYLNNINFESVYYKTDGKMVNHSRFATLNAPEKETNGSNVGRYIILGVSILVVIGVIVALVFIFRKYKPKMKNHKLFRDLSLFGVLILAFGLGYLNYYLWPKEEPLLAEITYRNEVYVTIDFKTNNVRIEKQQIDKYPILVNETDYSYVTLLGDYKIDGARQEVTIQIDFKEAKIQVSQEKSPHNYCSLQGWTKRGSIICLPNNIAINFRAGEHYDLAL